MDDKTIISNRTLTYDQLKKEVEDEWDNMSEIEQSCRVRDSSPTFKMYVLSSLKPHQSIILNEEENTYEIIINESEITPKT